jgi:hypothetical protein
MLPSVDYGALEGDVMVDAPAGALLLDIAFGSDPPFGSAGLELIELGGLASGFVALPTPLAGFVALTPGPLAASEPEPGAEPPTGPPPLLMPEPEPDAPAPAPPAPPPPACAKANDVYEARASENVAPRMIFANGFIGRTSLMVLAVVTMKFDLDAVAMARPGCAAISVTAMAIGRTFVAGVGFAFVGAELLSRLHFA